MKNSIRIIMAALLLSSAATAVAQNLNSAYFMNGYAYGHELNPAQEYDRKSYFSFPLLGNLNLGVRGNLNLKDILMQKPDGSGLATYLHPSISYDAAMKGFGNNNKIQQDLSFEILSVGFHSKKAYHTIGLRMRENVGLNVPFELFSMTKRLENRNYDLSNLGFRAQAFGELGYSYSRNITKAIRIGAKAKVLFGGAYANVNLDNLNLDLTDANRWVARAKASAEIGTAMGFKWGQPEYVEYENQYPGHMGYEQIDMDEMDIDEFQLNLGGALDLGAEWDLGKQGIVKGLKVSAAVLDLGFIKWNGMATAANRGEEFVFEGFNNIKVGNNNPGSTIEDQTENLTDDISDLMSLQDMGTKSKAKSLSPTLNIGVQYTLPQYDKLSFGLLSTTRFGGKYGWNEERFSVNYSPVKWLEGNVNVSVGTFGTSIGWMLNIHPRGFSFFVGSDHSLIKLSKQYVPLSSNADFTMGINFPLGRSRK